LSDQDNDAIEEFLLSHVRIRHRFDCWWL